MTAFISKSKFESKVRLSVDRTLELRACVRKTALGWLKCTKKILCLPNCVDVCLLLHSNADVLINFKEFCFH